MNFLPGMQGVINMIAAAPRVASVAVFGSSTSSSPSMNFPAGIQEGDLLVHMDTAWNTSGIPSSVLPVGFINIFDTPAANRLRQIVSYKIATGSESGSLAGMTGATEETKAMYVFRGDIPITGAVVGSTHVEATDGNPVAQLIAAASGTPPLIVFGCMGCTSPIGARPWSPEKDGEIHNTQNGWLGYKIYNSAPADVSIDQPDEGSFNIQQSFYIAVS
jgi:hypothetical protein